MSVFIRPFLIAAAAPFAVMAVFFFSTAAQAMSVSPVTLDLETTGKNKDQLNVVNDGATPLPVEIVISRMEMDESGRTSTKPAGDEFLLFPPQALIPPGAAQSFRLQWVGDPQIKQSQSYIFSVNQVPVRMPAGKSAIQVVFNFATIVNVAPPAGRAGIALVNAGIGKDDKGKLRPALTVKNPGNMHAKLTDATIKLAGGGWSQTLRPEELRQTLGVGLVQPGKTRRFLLPVDLPAGVSHVTASVDYKPAK